MTRSSSWCSLRVLGPVRRCALLLRGGLRCSWCGVDLTRASAELDHVVPRRHSGDDSAGNLVAACPDCNLDRPDGVDVAHLLALPIDLAAGRALALAWYPWAEARLEACKLAKRAARGREPAPRSETPAAIRLRARRADIERRAIATEAASPAGSFP